MLKKYRLDLHKETAKLSCNLSYPFAQERLTFPADLSTPPSWQAAGAALLFLHPMLIAEGVSARINSYLCQD